MACQTCVTLTSNVPNSLQIDQAGNVTALAPQNLNYTLSDTCGCCTGVAINGSTVMPVAVTAGQQVIVTILGCSGSTIASVTCQGSSSSSSSSSKSQSGSKSQSSASSQSSVFGSSVSGSTSASSTSGSIITACCPSNPMPNTLHVTFTTYNTTPSLALVYNGAGHWLGSCVVIGASPAGTYQFDFYCAASGINGWRCTVTDPLSGTETAPIFFSGNTCSPLTMHFNGALGEGNFIVTL